MSTEHLKRIGSPEPYRIKSANTKGEEINLEDYFENETLWEDIKWRVSEFIKKSWTYIRYDIPHIIRNLLVWRKTISRVRYWDYSFLIDIEKLYLRKLLERYEKYDIFVGQEEVARDIRLMIKLIDMMDNAYDENAFVNMRNSHRFVHSSLADKVKANEDCWSYKVMVRDEKIWNLYNLIRKYSLRRMWD